MSAKPVTEAPMSPEQREFHDTVDRDILEIEQLVIDLRPLAAATMKQARDLPYPDAIRRSQAKQKIDMFKIEAKSISGLPT